MRQSTYLALAPALLMAAPLVAQHKPLKQQIAEAVSPLPDAMQADATVMGYAEGDTLGVIRLGLNMMICLADDPKIDGFHAACYHRDLEPFMARGRQLRAQGKTTSEIQTIRMQEIEAGKLHMPDHPAALYNLRGEVFDHEMEQVIAGRVLNVIYVPYATEESTGIPSTPTSAGPWLMFPGTPWAHVMISVP